MKRFYMLAAFVVLIVGCVAVACDFKDPLLDGDGENINLVRLDLPKFDARYTINIVDNEGNPITDATAELDFIGRDANILITDVGRVVMKENSDAYVNYRTAKFGMLGLNLNPNFKVSSHNVEFQINGSDLGMGEYVVIPKVVKQTVAGDLCVDVTALKLPIKSDAMTDADLLVQGRGDAEMVALLSGHNGNGYNMIALYRSTATEERMFSCVDKLDGYRNSGIYRLDDDMMIAPTQSKRVVGGGYFVVVECPSKLVEGGIKIDVNSEMTGVATSFRYTINSMDGKILSRGSICGTFPFSSTIEQIFVPAASPQVSITIENSTMCDIVCDQSQTVTISATSTPTIAYRAIINDALSDDLRRSEVSVVGVCSTNKQIAFYPTLRFQYTIKDSNLWEWAESRGGNIVMMLENDEDYTIRMPINNTWQSFGITTKRDKIEGIVRDQPNVSKFDLINNTDGSMSMNVEYRDQEFCDLTL